MTRWGAAALCAASVAWGQPIDLGGGLWVDPTTFDFGEWDMAGVFGSSLASQYLREARDGNANVIVAVVAPSFSYYRGYGLSGAVEHALDGGVTGFENAGSAFVGWGRSATEGSGLDGKSPLYTYSLMTNHATDSQTNNVSAEALFAAWQGSNVLADCVNVRNGVTITEDAAIVCSSACSWYPTNEGDDDVTIYAVYGQYGGEAGNLTSARHGARNLNTTNNTAGSTFQTATITNPDLNGEITGTTAIARTSYSTPYSASSKLFGTADDTTTGFENRLFHFSSGPVGGRQGIGKFFSAGAQILRKAANAGNSIRWTIVSSGGADYADMADFFDAAGERGAAILRGDEMADNFGRRGDTRPTYVIFAVFEDANTYQTLGDAGTQSQYNAQISDLFDNLKLIGDGFTSVDGWAIMHIGQPPFHTANARNTAYNNYRAWAASFAQSSGASYNLQYLNPVLYTDPTNSWTVDSGNDRGGELFYDDTDPDANNVHFNRDGYDVIATEALEASLGYGLAGGWRTRTRHPRTR